MLAVWLNSGPEKARLEPCFYTASRTIGQIVFAPGIPPVAVRFQVSVTGFKGSTFMGSAVYLRGQMSEARTLELLNAEH
jgi:hypothetical protein